MPSTVFSSTGGITASAMKVIFAGSPMPNHTAMSGIHAKTAICLKA